MSEPHTTQIETGEPRGAAMLIVAAMLCGIVWSVGIDVYNRFFIQGAGWPQIVMTRYAVESDPMIARSAGGGGLYMRFVNFGDRKGFITNLYFRANYILFPQRVLVGDPSAPINTVDQVLAANFIPDDSWLLSHNVPTMLTYFYVDGQLHARVHSAAPSR
ncbi:MAG: hypothetical protein ABSF29_04680 [Tepidisphaeraceae bacterium]|jgi:hypothetical protein